MSESFRSFWGSGIVPYLYCRGCASQSLWLSICLSLILAVAHFAIVWVLLVVAFTRKDGLFRSVAVLMSMFLGFWGTMQLLGIWKILHSEYDFVWPIRACMTILPVITAIALVRLRPVLQRVPTFSDLEKEIRDRHHAEESARDLHERFQSYVEGVQTYAIYLIDLDGRVQTWNTGAERIKGYAAQEIIGRKFSCFYTAEDMAAGKPEEAIREAMETGEYEAEGWRVRKDGSRFWARVIVRPSRDASGMLRGFTKITQDLTEQRAMEAKYQMLLEATPDAIFIIGRPGRIEYMNRRAEEIFGLSRTEVLSKSIDILIPERMRELRARERAAYFESPSSQTTGYESDFLCVRSNGEEFPAEVSRSPLETADGLVILTSVRDVSERLKLETQFRTLLESAPDAVVIYGPPDQITYVNRRAEELFGFDREELLGQPSDILLAEHLREERRTERKKIFHMVTTQGLSTSGERTFWRKDGSEFAVEINVSRIETAEGPSLLAFMRDITERKRTETRFRALLESAPDAMVIADGAGIVELVNAQAERLFGYTRDEMIGQPVHILIPPDLRESYGQDSAGILQDNLQRQIAPEVDLRACRKDGTEFPVEISFSPLEGPNGVSLTAAIRDITERKRTETRFRALLESAPDAMVIVNHDGCIEIANLQMERLFGYGRSELVGQNVDMLVPHALRAGHREQRGQFFAAPRQREMGAGLDLMAVRKDGSEFPVEISLSPLEGPTGTSVTAAIRDTTERRLAGQQLAAKIVELRISNEALEQFAHIASHDLQEPLRMVASYVQLLSRRYKGRLDADADEFIAYAVDGTQRMKRLIEDLLLYSRAGKGGPDSAEFRSEAALAEAIGNLNLSIEESGAVITHDELPEVVGVESQVVQIFQNLIGNAIKYRGDAAPHIHVSAAAIDKEWAFSVADNGLGIDPQYHDRIFVIFQRLHGRQDYPGTGIGLAICKRILQQQGGRIWVESEPDRGSVFHFSLPRR